MKILHVSRTMGQGGAEKIVYQLCKDNDGHVQCIASTGGIYEEKLEKQNIKHFIIPDIDGKNPFQMMKCFKLLKKIIKEEKIDIIHTHHRMAAFYARIIKMFKTNLVHVYTAHNVFNNKRFFMRFALKNAKIVAVGQGVKNNLVDVYGICSEDIEVIYNSIVPNKTDTQVCQEIDKERKNGKIIIGNIGRITEQKGIDIFLKAISKIVKVRKDIYAVIVGDGEAMQSMQHMADELNIRENVCFLGYRSDVFNIISQLDFVVLSSRWEGFPLTPIETFSMGKTIVASDIDGNNEIVNHMQNGLLFDKEDIDDLANKIQLMLSDTRMRLELEEKAMETFEKHFSYSVFIQKYNEVYNK